MTTPSVRDAIAAKIHRTWCNTVIGTVPCAPNESERDFAATALEVFADWLRSDEAALIADNPHDGECEPDCSDPIVVARRLADALTKEGEAT